MNVNFEVLIGVPKDFAPFLAKAVSDPHEAFMVELGAFIKLTADDVVSATSRLSRISMSLEVAHIPIIHKSVKMVLYSETHPWNPPEPLHPPQPQGEGYRA